MDNQNSPFSIFPYSQFAMEDTFQPFVFEGHYSPGMGSYIDPSLQPLHGERYPSQWEREPPQVKRWMADDHRNAYFNADPCSKMTTPPTLAPIGTLPVPPPSQVRFASPISSSDYGLTASSPQMDGESFYDNNLPSTPSDSVALSPSYRPGHSDYYNSQESSIQFGNMGPAAPPAYVKPEDVDPSRQLGYHDAEASQSNFSLDHRTDSYESATSYHDIEQIQDQINVTFRNRRMSSPEEMQTIKVEDEVHSQYPPIPERDDDEASETTVKRPALKRKREDDDDYAPGKKSRPSVSLPPRRTRPKPPHCTLSVDGTPRSKQTGPSMTSAKPPPRPVAPSSIKAKVFSCPHCKHTFKDTSSLDTHVKKQHTRPFKCVFHFAGCTSTFASKNEWKRHNSTQHLVLRYWLCTEGACGKPLASTPTSSTRPKPRSQSGPGNPYSNTFNPPPAPAPAPAPSSPGARFNRKDLYTQHIRRMHMHPSTKKALDQLQAQKKSAAQPPAKGRKQAPPSALELTRLAWEEELKARQESALQSRIALPGYMRCPATGCHAEFRGGDAWDQRMEHVAKHLESGDKGEVVFGGERDGTLVEWAASPEVGVVVREGNGWVLRQPLRKGGAKGKAVEQEGNVEVVGGEEDADGEDDNEI